MDLTEYLMDLYIEKYGKHINKEIAEALVNQMSVTDGTNRADGEKYTYSEAKELGTKIGVDFGRVDPVEWYLVLNMMYSDHYRTGKKHGLTESTLYCELAYDWFYDVDGEDCKTFNYFMA